VRQKVWLSLPPILALTALVAFSVRAYGADDTVRFYGTWQTPVVINGQTISLISLHDASGYKNHFHSAAGDTPAGEGGFSAANGRYTALAPKPNDAGTYHFLSDDTVVCTNAAGQTATWTRLKASAPGATPSGAAATATVTAATPSPPPPAAYDPSLPPETNAAIAAFGRGDYPTAWKNFMAAAQKGDAEAEAGVGAMLFKHLNPPGTGFYAQCEKWLLLSANQGNTKGMGFLAQYYYASAVAIAGGINPGVNNAPVPPALQQQAEGRFAQARQWFERASDKGDVNAMGNLAQMLDAGVGGPRDPGRAAQLRAKVKAGPDANFAHRATADPAVAAMRASWQASHYADAVQQATVLANKGNGAAQALLARAYYEGMGVERNYATAVAWAQKAAAQNDVDGLYYLGLMYYEARGVPRDFKAARDLFTRSGKLGNTLAMQKLSDIYYLSCKPMPSYAPNGDYVASQCPDVDPLSDRW
jgi:TPR repeat protein